MSEAAILLEQLVLRGATVATAESLTGGQLAAAITAVPGASRAYLGGAVTYATELKIALLGVPAQLVSEHGVVSAACAQAMAEGVRTLTGADFAVSTTGVAGPDRQDGQPVGTVFVGVSHRGGVGSRRFAFAGDRAAIQRRSVAAAIGELVDVLHREELGLG